MTKILFHRLALFLSIVTLFIFVSCRSTAESENSSAMISDSASKSIVENKDSLKPSEIISLPAPMQIASAIRKNSPKYYEEFLCPITNGVGTNFFKTINLGIYAVDLGYANVYQQKQTSINYFVACIKLADELEIMGPVDPAILKAFKETIGNKDSVKRYTLSTFGKIHYNLIKSDRKNEAFLILTGSFVEGVYLASKIQARTKDKNLMNLVGEQKLFLENILNILPYYKDEKGMAELIAQLDDLKVTYNKIEITYTESAPNKKKMQAITISDDVLKQISDKITAIRTSIILAKG